jgi:hypothetical protein
VAYVKSVLAGLGAAAVVAMGMGLYVQNLRYKVAMLAPAGDSYVEFHWHKGVVAGILLFAFIGGFWWQYRRGR